MVFILLLFLSLYLGSVFKCQSELKGSFTILKYVFWDMFIEKK